jgi:hypothetical protein
LSGSHSSPPKLVLRAQRRTLADLSGYTAHQRRSGGDLSHVDVARTPLNRVLVGSDQSGQDIRTAINVIATENLNEEVKGLRKTRGKKAAAARQRKGPAQPWDVKNTKPWTEVVLSASPAWFRDPGQGPGKWNNTRVDAYVARAEAVLRRRFGDDLVHLSLHLDEETPHLHAAILPTVEKTSKRRGRQRIVSHRQHEAFRQPKDEPENLMAPGSSYERLQDEFATDFRDLGIERGQPHAFGMRTGDQEPTEHLSTAQWQAKQKQAHKCAQKACQEAESARVRAKVAEAAFCASEARTVALMVGVEALADNRLAYESADDKPERLGFGSTALKSELERRSLLDRIRPAYRDVLALSRMMHDVVCRLVEPRERFLSEREAFVDQRERDVGRDAATLSIARHQAGRSPDPLIEIVRLRRLVGRGRER